MDKNITKEQYIKIVEFTLDAMMELSENYINYSIESDLFTYYETKIKKDNVISFDEFIEMCKSRGIQGPEVG